MANIYQAGGKLIGKGSKALGDIVRDNASKVYTTGVKKESALAEKLGTATGEKAIQESLVAESKAADALELLKKQGAPTFKTTVADLQSFAKDNPKAKPEELAAMYRGEPVKEPTSAPREIEEPASQERVYEAYGKAADGESQFDERSAGLEGLVSRPQDEVVGTGMGTPPAKKATISERISKSGWNKNRPLTATQKAMLGIGGATAAGTGIEQALKNKEEGTPLVLSPSALGLPPEPETEVKPADDTKKEQQDKLTTPSGGDVTPPKELQKKASIAPAEKQVQTAAAAELTLEDFKKKLLGGEPLTRGDLLVVLDKMQNIKPDEVKVDTSVVEKLQAARDEARNAYQSQASRNEWLEVAQTLGNAVATFIAAQRGVADRPLGLPQIDYGERTTRALREYQTELGSIGEQERALERETERGQKQAEQKFEAERRSWEKYLLLGEKQIEAAERKAEHDKDLATRIQIAKAEDARRLEYANKKAATEQAKAAKQGQKEYLSALTKDSARLEKELNTAKAQLKATQSLISSDPKNFNKNFTNYVSSFSTTDKPVKREDYEKPGLLWGTNFYPEDAKKDASTRAREIIEKIQFLTQEQNRNLDEQKEIVGGLRGVSPTTTQQPARQEPAAGGKVTLRDPKSGRTKEVLWDEAAQAVVKSGQLELVK